MFGIKKKFKELDDLKEKVADLEFVLNNPPKFKDGDTVGNLKIMNHSMVRETIFEPVGIFSLHELHFEENYIRRNSYTCYDTVKNNVVYYEEEDLLKLKKELG